MLIYFHTANFFNTFPSLARFNFCSSRTTKDSNDWVEHELTQENKSTQLNSLSQLNMEQNCNAHIYVKCKKKIRNFF